MERREALGRLAVRHGIEAAYRDAAGMLRETGDELRERLLAAMGAPPGDDPAALLAAEEAEDWARALPPVCVCRRGAAATVDFHLAAGGAGSEWRWSLRLEAGDRLEGAFRPDELEVRARRSVPAGERLRLALPLPAVAVTGYHEYTVAPAAGGEAAAMPLIVAPARCHQPALGADARCWGLALQLYGLRSRGDWGVGDFGALGRVAEALGAAGAAFIGLGPLHALFRDAPERCSPYSPNSRLFLNTLYIDVEAVEEVRGDSELRQRLADPAFQARLRQARAAGLVDYPEAAALKLAILRRAFAAFRREAAAESARARAWLRFREEGGEALERFALFEAMRAHRAGEAVPAPGSAAALAFAAAHREEIDFAVYLQWLADEQLGAAAGRGRRAGLGLGFYCDLALGADAGGADVWSWPQLFATGAGIGAPPDAFSPQGQDWGLPPPIPRRLREAAYRPFIAALRAAMRHAGALRIDHVMGLERLFWVPAGEPPAAGAYVRYPADDLFAILALESERNRCLVIGEDLGTVPEALRARLAGAGILSCRPLLFEKDADGAFRPPADYPRQALASVSTHDLPTLAGFWRGSDIEARARLGLFADPAGQEAAVVGRAQERARLLIALQREGLLPAGSGVHPIAFPVMDAVLAGAVHRWLARTPALLLAVQAEDLFGVEEQANLPGAADGAPNWRRRLPVEVEDWPGDERLRRLAAILAEERGGTPGVPGGAPRTAVIPGATYRLQFNRDFTLAQAAALVDYLHELGVSHCYASPLQKARPGSAHGYDVVDHNAFNPEIGSDEDFRAFSDALAARGMGLILDIVPNHMGIMGADNAWWLDVLENGQASACAGYFDIDWRPLHPGLAGKVLLPILGDHYGSVLARGELQLRFDAGRGEFSLHYYQHRLPIDPAEYPRIVGPGLDNSPLLAGEARLAELHSLLTAFGHLPGRDDASPAAVAERARDKEVHKRHLAALCADLPALAEHIRIALAAFNGSPGDAASFDALHGLIAAQAWRPAYWRVAADEINYRRFFDINDLAALRMENPEVFAATHRLVLALVAAGRADGLRIDHADGLHDPAAYFRRLQEGAGGGSALADPRRPPLYVVIEKILAEHERLPEDWPIHGDTGYRFANLVNGLFVDTAAEGRMTRIYAQFAGERRGFPEILHAARRQIIHGALQGELNVLANRLWHIATASRDSCDFTLYGLRGALAEVVACFPVYRNYFADGRLSADDRRHIEWALGLARRHSRAADASVFDFIGTVLSGDLAGGRDAAQGDEIRRFAMKFQQFTAPVTAKGMEDTAFYRYHRLVSLNDVGGDPQRFGVGVAAFHAANRARAERWPHCLLAGSTHDSKRAEDVRARIDVLSEAPAAWKLALRRWSRLNRSRKTRVGGRPAPSANDEYLLYQTLFGTWPLVEPQAGELEAYARRIGGYMLKAVREAKERSSWIKPDSEYEAALAAFVATLLAPGPKNLFLADFVPAVRRLAGFGLVNSLAQTLLRLTSPGVPDIYQGCELWQFNLVDPDNRRPVDYALRRRLLAEVGAVQAGPPAAWREGARRLAGDLADGRAKLYLIRTALQLRRRWPEVFRDGEYLPLTAAGSAAAHVCAYARRQGGRIAIATVPRLLARLQGERAAPDWNGTHLEIPAEWQGLSWFNALTGETLVPAAALALADLLADFPVALLIAAPQGVDSHF